jgi:branched-chain amino acid transport system ATP-binding protein
MSPAVLSAHGVAAGYNNHAVVHDLDLEVEAGQVVTLLGPNGAGKTTTLMTLAGALSPLEGEVRINGELASAPLHQRARAGLSFVTEERSVFSDLTTRENLRVGRCDVDRALGLFPELERLLNRRAGLLSGGEQQMLTLARAMARRPKLLLADELSLGLAPLMVKKLLGAVRRAADDENLAVVLVEQHVSQALEIADYVYVLRRGRIVMSGTPEAVAADVQYAYIAEPGTPRAGT